MRHDRLQAVMNTSVVVCPHCGRRNRVPAAASGVPRCGNCHRPLPWVVDADDETFAEVVEGSAIPVLVDLWAPWCGPCRMVSPALERLAQQYAGRIKLAKVNADEAPRTSQRFGVQAIPTLLVMNRDRVVARQVGAAPEDQLRKWLDEAVASIA
jgi:thioredoxin 2